jgi:hypothetical protein
MCYSIFERKPVHFCQKYVLLRFFLSPNVLASKRLTYLLLLYTCMRMCAPSEQARALALEVVAKLVHLRHAAWLPRLLPLLQAVLQEYRRRFGHAHAGLQVWAMGWGRHMSVRASEKYSY